MPAEIFLAKALGYLVVVFLLLPAGNVFCRWVVSFAEPPSSGKPEGQAEGGTDLAKETTLKGGRVIGVLERLFVFVGIAMQRWELIAGVIALKSVARYQDLREQENAEYFLIGSLASILWAIVIAFAALAYDRYLGFDLFPAMTAIQAGGE